MLVSDSGGYRIKNRTFESIYVDQAPSLQKESSRENDIVGHSSEFEEKRLEFENETRKRNEKYLSKYEEICRRKDEWEQAFRSLPELQNNFDESLLAASKEEEDLAVDCFRRFHQEHRLVEERQSLFEQGKKFPESTNYGGQVAKRLEEASDSFQVDNAKVSMRESKIYERFKEHVDNTSRSIRDEKDARIEKFSLLLENINANERRDDRNDEIYCVATNNAIHKVEKALEAERLQRQKEDDGLVDSMIALQTQLQSSILKASKQC